MKLAQLSPPLHTTCSSDGKHKKTNLGRAMLSRAVLLGAARRARDATRHFQPLSFAAHVVRKKKAERERERNEGQGNRHGKKR